MLMKRRYDEEQTEKAQQDVVIAQKELSDVLSKKKSKNTVQPIIQKDEAVIKKPVKKLKKLVKLNQGSN